MADKTTLQKYAALGYHLTPLRGKIPIHNNWQKTPYDPTPDTEDFPDNFGVVLQDSDLVIDVDPRNFKKGVNSFFELQRALGWRIKDTATPVVLTGGGGFHVYLKKPADLPIIGEHDDYPGVEFKTKGAQVVGLGSIHPNTKKIYSLVNGEFRKGAIERAPQELLSLITRAIMGAPAPRAGIEATDEQTKSRFVDYCKIREAAIEGHGGDKTTYMVACHGRDLGLSQDDALAIMSEHYNPRCSPPWKPEELARKVENAYQYSKGTQGDLHPTRVFPKEEGPTPPVNIRWDKNKSGGLLPTLNNCVNFFAVPKSELFGFLAWDSFTDHIAIVKRAPWHPESLVIPPDGLPWTEEDEVQCQYYLSKVKKYDVKQSVVHSAIIIAAQWHENHPVKNWLNGLVWDQKPRLDTWLTEYCGAPRTNYVSTVGVKTLLGAVARVYHPGIKFDYMLVLEGEQGSGKSTTVKALGGPWYADIAINPHDKDTLAAMRGKWIIEASEMAFTSLAETQAQKAFLSRSVDVSRAAYARNARSVPRQCIFIGTINVDAEGGYLRDSTGNRRFWPVITGFIRPGALKQDRDQLFAEAVFRYKKGEPLYLDNETSIKEAIVEQQARRHVDPWTDRIEQWLEKDQFGMARDRVATMEIWVECLGGLEKQLDRRHASRVASVMRDELKWSYVNAWVDKRQLKCWKRPPYLITDGIK